jgi:DNA-binding response OmpR family regulator
MTDRKTILCVEDDKDSYELLQLIFENVGFKVVTCCTSTEGLEMAKQNTFSAIILDNRLADISGVEICRQIRTYDQQTPIVFYSGSAYPKDKKAGLKAGANDYLVKPNDFDNLVPITIKLIKESEQTLKFAKV